MKIKITSTQIKVRDVVRSRDQKKFTFREQEGLVSTANGEVRVVSISLEDGQQGFPVGEYTLLDSSFYVDRNSRLSLGRLHLSPVQAADTLRKAG